MQVSIQAMKISISKDDKMLCALRHCLNAARHWQWQHMSSGSGSSSSSIQSPCDVAMWCLYHICSWGNRKDNRQEKRDNISKLQLLKSSPKAERHTFTRKRWRHPWFHLLPLLLLFNNSHLTMLIDKKSTTTEFKFPSFVELCKSKFGVLVFLQTHEKHYGTSFFKIKSLFMKLM